MPQKHTHNKWELLKVEGWEEANNGLDFQLHKELIAAQARRADEGETLIQSAWIIRDNMLEYMNMLREFGARDSDPEMLLVNYTCHALGLPAGCINKFYKDYAI